MKWFSPFIVALSAFLMMSSAPAREKGPEDSNLYDLLKKSDSINTDVRLANDSRDVNEALSKIDEIDRKYVLPMLRSLSPANTPPFDQYRWKTYSGPKGGIAVIAMKKGFFGSLVKCTVYYREPSVMKNLVKKANDRIDGFPVRRLDGKIYVYLGRGLELQVDGESSEWKSQRALEEVVNAFALRAMADH